MAKGVLTRARVLAAAVALVDREGLEALSMRRLGEALGVEAMALYRHVASKDALLDAVYEAVLAGVAVPPATGRWAEDLRAAALAYRAALRAHPHALPLFATRPAVTPGALAHLEGLLAVLAAGGFDDAASVRALQVLVTYVVGHTLFTYGAPAGGGAGEPRYEALPPAAFPHVARVARVIRERDVEAEFAFGLDALLRGLRAARRGT